MSTQHVSKTSAAPPASSPSDLGSALGIMRTVLTPVASLRLTVTLFAMGIFIVLVGTLAQTRMNMWDVRDTYFDAWYCWIDFQVFFPRAWLPNWQNVWGGIVFPGGRAIGVAMAVNLVTAHLVRFKIQGKGIRLAAGLIIIAIGAVLCYLVIALGRISQEPTAQPMFDWQQLWGFFKACLTLTWLATAVAIVYFAKQGYYRTAIFWIFSGLVALVSLAIFWVWYGGGEAYLGDAGMRILWQLMQAEFAALVCLLGCWLVFKKRSGIVVLHAGIGLIMIGELVVSLFAVESQINLVEGGTTTYSAETRHTELAIIDRSNPAHDVEVVVPDHMLRGTEIVSHDDLPFDVGPVGYMENTYTVTTRSQFGAPRATIPTLNQVTQKQNGEFENPATAGAGLAYAAIEAQKSSGADANQRVDTPSAYVQIINKGTRKLMGVYLVTGLLKEQPIRVGDKQYDVSLRFRRHHLPFSIHLDQVEKEDYVHTNIPRTYASYIQLVDPEKGVDRSIKIWMNNPLRYRGETYYQSGYNEVMAADGTITRATTLQVVTNMGWWMIPYLGCMLVATGLLVQFSFSLARFLRKELGGPAGPAPAYRNLTVPAKDVPVLAESVQPADRKKTPSLALMIAPAVAISLGAALVFNTAIPRRTSQGQPRITAYAEGPIAYDGRIKPFDTLAMNSLRIISEKITFVDDNGVRHPATTWLVDVLSHTDRSLDHRVFRAENFDVLHTFGLTRRKGFLYSYNELAPKLDEFKKQVRQARSVDKAELNTYQKKALELDKKIELFLALREAHRVPDRGSEEDDEAELLITMVQFADRLANSTAPRAVPGDASDSEWLPLSVGLTANWIRQYAQAHNVKTSSALADHLAGDVLDEAVRDRLIDAEVVAMIESIVQREKPGASREEVRNFAIRAAENLPAHIRKGIVEAATRQVDQRQANLVLRLAAMITKVNGGEDLDVSINEPAAAMGAALEAYRADDVTAFNQQLARYEQSLTDARPEALVVGDGVVNRTVTGIFGSFYQFEAYYNRFDPFDTASWLYVVGFVLSSLAFLIWNRALRWTAFSLIAFTFVLHTFALLARIYISGRPPITNLYSSAVFIGWGCVLLALILEVVYRIGIGNILATVIGFLTLRVSFALAGDGDTFVVLQAVLDTQFWLATHVVCITLGYATTFLAGTLGIIYVFCYVIGSLTSQRLDDLYRILARMIYGVLCFAIFFSFIGTVLGGLWADDSWGRFWGWDPKENGALIIVLWNALILHARWAGVVKHRGLAILAVAGNITTTWSWFGVNELGIGLHSYGFTEGILMYLSIFVCSQLFIIAVGCLPWHVLSAKSDPPPKPQRATPNTGRQR